MQINFGYLVSKRGSKVRLLRKGHEPCSVVGAPHVFKLLGREITFANSD